MTMLEVLRSSVNTWECDRMGHLNVRHYFGRANEGLSRLLLELGLGPRELQERGWVLRARDQHVRFSHELRPGAGFLIRAGVTAASERTLSTYEELRTLDGDVSATIVSELELLQLADGRAVTLPESLRTASQRVAATVPDYAAVRGVTAAPTRVRPSRGDALPNQLIGAFLGPLVAEDCDAAGLSRESAFMAKISDGIPHFFRAIGEGPRPSNVGGAAVEYRFVFHEWPRVSDLVEVRSGLKAVGRKTLHMVHHIFSVETGRCVASSEAVAVWFDLQARKALEVPEDVRAQLQSHALAQLTI